ncbi:hypothetical protein vseg_000088 [Gypsophila vaccaria]
MKIVSGKVVSCQQISLSRAAKYISRFTASDNEASPGFAAYLRRTSAAFNDLVQLHKEYKIPLGEPKDSSSAGKRKGKKGDGEHSRNVGSASGGLGSEVQNDVHAGLKKSKKKKERDGDVAVVKGEHGGDHDVLNETRRVDGSEENNVVDVGGAAAKKSKTKRESDGDMASIDKVKLNGDDDVVKVSEVKNEIGGLGASEEVKNDVPDVGGTGKKSKKKRGNDVDVDVPSIENEQSHDTANPNEVDNKMGSVDASEDLKKKKKKKNKSDKHQKENHSRATEDVQLHPHREGDDYGEAADTVPKNGDEQKKQIREINVENKVEVIGEKKTRDEAEGRENGHNMETEATGKKESRKRKHERLADEELVGSPEAVRSKKKKHKH